MWDYSRTMESDSFFRSIPNDWFDEESGSVEAPTGWYGVVSIDADFRTQWAEDGLDQIPASVEDGTYLVQINDHGTVWAWGEGSQDPTTVAEFRAQLDEEYALWVNAEGE